MQLLKKIRSTEKKKWGENEMPKEKSKNKVSKEEKLNVSMNSNLNKIKFIGTEGTGTMTENTTKSKAKKGCFSNAKNAISKFRKRPKENGKKLEQFHEHETITTPPLTPEDKNITHSESNDLNENMERKKSTEQFNFINSSTSDSESMEETYGKDISLIKPAPSDMSPLTFNTNNSPPQIDLAPSSPGRSQTISIHQSFSAIEEEEEEEYENIELVLVPENLPSQRDMSNMSQNSLVEITKITLSTNQNDTGESDPTSYVPIPSPPLHSTSDFCMSVTESKEEEPEISPTPHVVLSKERNPIFKKFSRKLQRNHPIPSNRNDRSISTISNTVSKDSSKDSSKDMEQLSHEENTSMSSTDLVNNYLAKMNNAPKHDSKELVNIHPEDSQSIELSVVESEKTQHLKEKNNKKSKISKQPQKEKPKKNKHKSPWKAVLDKQTNNVYYYHSETNETTWEKPTQGFEAHDEKEAQQIQKRTDTDFSPILWAKRMQLAKMIAMISPDEPEANDKLMDMYMGREDELICQLENMLDETPFDEPAVGPSWTSQHLEDAKSLIEEKRLTEENLKSKSSLTTRSPQTKVTTESSAGTVSNVTEKVSNRQSNTSQEQDLTAHPETIEVDLDVVQPCTISHCSNQSTSNKSSPLIESHAETEEKDDFQMEPRQRTLVSEEYAGQKYELKAQEFTKSPSDRSKASSKRSKYSCKVPSSPGRSEFSDMSFLFNTDDELGSILSKKSISDSDLGSLNSSINKEHGRGRFATKLARKIRRSLSRSRTRSPPNQIETKSASKEEREYPQTTVQASLSQNASSEEWTQTDLDLFISNQHDWNNINSYIAKFKNLEPSSSIPTQIQDPNILNRTDQTQRKSRVKKYTKTLGARSQLQHEVIQNKQVSKSKKIYQSKRATYDNMSISEDEDSQELNRFSK